MIKLLYNKTLGKLVARIPGQDHKKVYTDDDIEEGTWTPTVTDASGVDAFSDWTNPPSGKYQRIGNRVVLSFHFRTGGTINPGCTSSDSIRIRNLPFTANMGAGYSTALLAVSVVDSPMAGLEPPYCQIGYSQDNISFRRGPLTGSGTNYNPQNFTIAEAEGGSGFECSCTITYFI